MYEPRLFSRSITILNPSIRTCFSSTCKARAPSWTGAFVSAMRLRFFDGRAASVSTGGIDNNNTLSDSFGQPTARLEDVPPASLSLFRGYERVLFPARFGDGFVVCCEIDRIDAIAFSVAMKKIAFTQFQFRFQSVQSFEFCCVRGATLRHAGCWRGNTVRLF